MDEKARVWSARILAPVAFLLAATALVILVQRALRDDSGSVGATGPAATVPVSTAVGETGQGTAANDRRFYRIKAGDTLEAIATRFDTTVDQLLELNPQVDPLALTPGRRIRVG